MRSCHKCGRAIVQHAHVSPDGQRVLCPAHSGLQNGDDYFTRGVEKTDADGTRAMVFGSKVFEPDARRVKREINRVTQVDRGRVYAL